jgi:hypothetical protein
VDDDFIDTGAAILNFYCTLVDLVTILWSAISAKN